MSVWRDHGNISPQEMRMSCYVPEERGVESVCQHGILERTGYALINVSRPDHTNLLSCHWTTCNSPCISPYLPFYIGINEVPEIASGPGNPLGEVFAELRLAVERHPEYWDEITQYWTVWEIQTIEESYGVEQEAAHLWDDGDEAEARDVLTEFVEEKCEEALEIGEDMLDFLNGLPMFEGFAEAEEAGPPYGVGPEESEKPEKPEK
jgi:dipeptidase